MNVLITGGAGFIGTALAKDLCEEGHHVTILDNFLEQVHRTDVEAELVSWRLLGVRFIRGSICSRSDVEKAVEGQDWIVHLAAETGTGQSMYELERYTTVNVAGTGLLLDVLINGKTGLKKIVVASSRSVYGEGSYICSKHGSVIPVPFSQHQNIEKGYDPICPKCSKVLRATATSETAPLIPMSVYASTKVSQEQLVLLSHASLNCQIVALRFQNVYGPGQSLTNPYTGILSIFTTSILNGNHLELFEDGLPSRDFVYIDDVIQGIVASLNAELCVPLAINIGSGERKTVLDVVHTLEEVLEKKAKYKISGRSRIGDIRHNYANLSLAQNALNYTPKIEFSQGVKQFVEWAFAQEIPLDYSNIASSELTKYGLLK